MKSELLIINFLLFSLLGASSLSSQPNGPVYSIPVKGVIDLGLSGFIKRALNDAKRENAKAVIFEIDTFGGRVDAAFEICEHIEDLGKIPSYAYVKNQAWSAGALVALACNKIFMAPGSSIGSAEPRAIGAMGPEEATDEKTISALRAKFKAVAEQNNHPLNLAQGMVDKDLEIRLVRIRDRQEILTAEETEGLLSKFEKGEVSVDRIIKPKGKLLTLTATESKDLGLAHEIISSEEELFISIGLKDFPVQEKLPTWSENLVRFLTHPIMSSLLLTLGILGIIFELKMPGWGITGTLGAICLALFFWGHYLVGLANWTEILLFIMGVCLIILEIFIFPGFGLAGAAGIIFVFSGLFLSLIKHPLHIPRAELEGAIYIFGYSFIGIFVGGYLILKFAPHTKIWKAAVLKEVETKEGGFTIPDYQIKIGTVGRAVSVLRPSGRARFGDETLDVMSEGAVIEKGSPIKVLKVEGNKIVVTDRLS